MYQANITDHPLAEVFGFPIDNMSSSAQRARANRLCPYNNRVPNCTKDKAENPLGVCSEIPLFDSPPVAPEHVVNVASVPHRSPFRYPGGKLLALRP